MSSRATGPGRLSLRFWLDSALAATSAIVLLLTLLWHDWIELAFHVEPDGGSGAAEWLIVAIAASAALTGSALAAAEWRRVRAV